MSAFKGTPGPWKAVLGSGTWTFLKPTTEIHGPRGEIIAILVGHGADGEHEPESRLIAAAPALLSACQTVLAWFDDPNWGGPHPLDHAHEAIAAALGEVQS